MSLTREAFFRWMVTHRRSVAAIGALVIGALPFFVGLAVVLPVLGHSTWHLYRKLVEN